MKHGDGSIILFLFSWDRESSQEIGNHLFGRPRHITDYQQKWHLTNNDLNQHIYVFHMQPFAVFVLCASCEIQKVGQ